MFHIFPPGGVECDLIRERRQAGLEPSWVRGHTESRPPLLSGDKLRTARENPRADQLLPLNPRGGVSEVGISIAGTSQLFGDRINSAYSDTSSRPRASSSFENQPVALVRLRRKRWRVGESVGASLIASAGEIG